LRNVTNSLYLKPE